MVKKRSSLSHPAKVLAIEKVVDHWPKKGKTQKYLCRWVGYSPDNDTWESAKKKEIEVPLLIEKYRDELERERAKNESREQTERRQAVTERQLARAKALKKKTKIVESKLGGSKLVNSTLKEPQPTSKPGIALSKQIKRKIAPAPTKTTKAITKPTPKAIPKRNHNEKLEKPDTKTIEIRTEKRGVFEVDLFNLRIRGHGTPPGQSNLKKFGLLLKDGPTQEKFWLILDDTKTSGQMQRLLKNHIERYVSRLREKAENDPAFKVRLERLDSKTKQLM